MGVSFRLRGSHIYDQRGAGRTRLTLLIVFASENSDGVANRFGKLAEYRHSGQVYSVLSVDNIVDERKGDRRYCYFQNE